MQYREEYIKAMEYVTTRYKQARSLSILPIRAIARDIGMDAGDLSNGIRGVRPFQRDKLLCFLAYVGCSEQEARRICLVSGHLYPGDVQAAARELTDELQAYHPATEALRSIQKSS